MSYADRIIRTLMALTIVFIWFSGIVAGVGKTILLLVALVLSVTSMIGFCPLYRVFGLKTCKT